ncbi:hypothetical protein J6590_010595 [Homalodisca vitripennis]|nr:hypothetical protein J6590_010595 [Homalodisca vitripennis]
MVIEHYGPGRGRSSPSLALSQTLYSARYPRYRCTLHTPAFKVALACTRASLVPSRHREATYRISPRVG